MSNDRLTEIAARAAASTNQGADSPCQAHVADCYQCRRDRTRVAYLRRLLAEPETAGVQDREPFQRADEGAHEAHLATCGSCQSVAGELRRLDQEAEERAMRVAAHVVWPDGRRLQLQAVARRANGRSKP
ncbi:hypothetical protein AB0O20_06800 [Streptomyces kronopolitis]|uniref:hypothetical protein n=1 Tax=Streptomyces kronopolitis TaxID=1612435 RepID=UPI0034495ED8